MRSPDEAREYLVRLRQILRYIGVSKANMEEGNFRCDANVSPAAARASRTSAQGRSEEHEQLPRGARCARVRRSSARRARSTPGDRIAQETRGWVDERGETVSQRSKEEAHDYRYFPEPDLPPLTLGRRVRRAIRVRGCRSCPDATQARFEASMGCPAYEASLLTESREQRGLLREALAPARSDGRRDACSAKPGSGELDDRRLRAAGSTRADWRSQMRVSRRADLYGIIALVEDGHGLRARREDGVRGDVPRPARPPADVVRELGLEQISGTDEIAELVGAVIAANPKPVADYRAGKQEAMKFLVGQAMRETRGRANPATLTEMLTAKLAGEGVDMLIAGSHSPSTR